MTFSIMYNEIKMKSYKFTFIKITAFFIQVGKKIIFSKFVQKMCRP